MDTDFTDNARHYDLAVTMTCASYNIIETDPDGYESVAAS